MNNNDNNIVQPLDCATTFIEGEAFLYARVNHPNAVQLETELAALEQGKAALVFTSGMAAISSLLHTFPQDTRLIIPKFTYFTLQQWLENNHHIKWQAIDFYDLNSLNEIKDCDYIWLEVLDNPYWRLCDLEAIIKTAHAKGAKVIIDNTAASPIICQPFQWGADIIVHSLSKWIGGHHDTLGGAIIFPDSNEFYHQLSETRRLQGNILSPFSCWLLLRSLKTLEVRVRQSAKTAQEFATYFAHHPAIKALYYCGLEDNASHALAKKYFNHGLYGGVLSLELNIDPQVIPTFLASLTQFKNATSFGGVESFIEQRYLREPKSRNLPATFLRLSMGLEAADILIKDFEERLEEYYLSKTTDKLDQNAKKLYTHKAAWK